jgi:hypothetical protein
MPEIAELTAAHVAVFEINVNGDTRIQLFPWGASGK